MQNASSDIGYLVDDMFSFLDQKITDHEIAIINDTFLKQLLPSSYSFKTASYVSPGFIKNYREIINE